MASDPLIKEARGLFEVSVDASATTFLAGTPIGYNGSAWVKADADANTVGIYARGFCLRSVSAGASATYTMPCAREVVVFDADAPYTVDAKQYLSATVGLITETRPTTAGAIRQVLGQAVTTDTLALNVRGLREVNVPFKV